MPVLQKKPLSTVPFDKDPEFVGREDILGVLKLQFSRPESHKRVVLVGLGGVGYILSPFSFLYLTIA